MTRVFTLDDTAAILDVFQKHGHTEVDTSRVIAQAIFIDGQHLTGH